MRTGPDLAPALAASVAYVREAKRQRDDIDEWIEAVPVPPKRLKRKKMTASLAKVPQHETNSLARTAGDAMAEWRAMREQAKELVASGFLPRAVNSPEKAIAIIQTGRELGLGPMQALRTIHIIEGKPCMSADLIAGLALRHVPGAVLRVAETTEKVCVVQASRSGQDLTTFRFSIEDAQKAGLTGKDNWRKYPRAMLRARAITEAARAIFPDAVMGLYDPDELGATTDASGQVVVTQARDLDTGGAYSPHHGPGEDPSASGDEDLFRGLCARFSKLETDLETCDSWEKCNALRAVLGTRAAQSELTRTMQLKAESGDISPSQRQELGKTWMRANRKLEKLEEKLRPSVEASFTDEPDGTEALGAPERQPGEDDE